MRDPNRLDELYDKLKKYHKEVYPDWRFGQLISNFFGYVYGETHRDTWFLEDEDWVKWIDKFFNLDKEDN